MSATTDVITSKTNIMLAVTVIAAIGSIVGVKLDPDKMSELVTDLTSAANVLIIVGPIAAGVYHHLSKARAQTAMVNAGMTHDDAKAATKS